MKKTIASFFVLLCLIGVLFACDKKEEPKTMDLQYDIQAELTEKTVTAKQKVSFVNTLCDGLSELIFHLYPNCYTNNGIYKAYSGIRSYGGITIEKVFQTENCAYSVDETGEYLTVSLPAVALGEQVELFMEYSVVLPEARLRFGYNEGVYALTHFYPILSIYRDGAFLKDPFSTVGDPFCAECADYSVEFTCPSRLVVASSGTRTNQTTTEDTTTYDYQCTQARDFALCASENFQVLTEKVFGTDISFFYTEDIDCEKHFSLTKSAFSSFSDAFGSAQLDAFSVVLLPFDYDGMEFSGLAFISENSLDKESAILHETAHQWWYNLVGNDGIRQSALDEGLASFSSLYYYCLIGDETTFATRMESVKKTYTLYETLQQRRSTGLKLHLNGTIYDYTSYQYTMLMYYKSCMMFNNVYELYGKEKMNGCLKSFAEQYAHRVATLDDFSRTCSQYLKTDITGLMTGWVGEKSTITTFSTTSIS